MEELIKRVAIAIVLCDYPHLDPTEQEAYSDQGMEGRWTEHKPRWTWNIGRARAAVLATLDVIREPTEDMLRAACAEAAKEQVRPVAIHRTDAELCWRVMIDALKDTVGRMGDDAIR